MNSGVCISDSNFGDYFGWIKKIIQVEYPEAPLKKTVLFKCEWFDPTMDVGVKRHNQYKWVDINQRRRYKKYEPFILAMQATQVCYVSYPNKKKDKDDWVAVLKVKPRNVIELPDEGVEKTSEQNLPFQVDEVEVHEIDMTISIDEDILLNDPNGDTMEMDEPIDDGLLQEHHEEDQEEEEFEEYEIEETEEDEEDQEEEEFEEDIDSD
uniref:TdcA1-ORF2 protein n=1 Tax=Solanum tuberosum TaxID=4113 RepID=M1B3N4_SOLTU